MKKLVVILLSVIMLCSCVAFCGCSKPVELVDTYQVPSYIRLYKTRDTMDFYVVETAAVQLYSDGTYVCEINVSEEFWSFKNEYAEVNELKPLAVTTLTRFGTYELSVDEDLGEFTLKLSDATRLIYATNAGGGHYPLVPTNKVVYVDSIDEAATAAFETEWFGNWDSLMERAGSEITLTGNSETHICANNTIIFDYDTCMFATL